MKKVVKKQNKCYNLLGDTMKVVINDIKYEIIKDYKNGFDKEEVTSKLTDYFFPYDYILGDWAYNKLRLKGFCDQNNEIYNKINDISILDDYIKNNCAYDCRYFVMKKLK